MTTPLFPAGELYSLEGGSRARYVLGERAPIECGNNADQSIFVFDSPRSYAALGFVETVELFQTGAPVAEQVLPLIAFMGRPMDTISVWIDSPSRIDVIGELPPLIRFDIRRGFATATELAASVTVAIPQWNDSGMIVQVSGVLATRWEVWAAALSTGGPTRPQQRVRMRVSALIDDFGCCTSTVKNGPWVV